MADNVTVDNAGLTDYTAATDKVTYSGDTADVQLMRPVHVTGSEGSKTVVDASSADGLLAAVGPGFDRRVTSTTFDGANDAITIGTGGAASVIFTFEDGDLVGTVSIEASRDGGSTWAAFTAWESQTGTSASSFTDALPIDHNLSVVVNAPYSRYNGTFITHVRLRVSAYTSGSVTVAGVASVHVPAMGLDGPAIRLLGTDGDGRMGLAEVGIPGDASSGTDSLAAESYLMNYNGTTWDRVRGTTANGLDVDVTRLPALVAGTANIGDVDVLTVPAPLSTTGGGTEATAHRVTIASDSTGVLSVDDNGSSLTVDGTVTASNTAGDVAHGTGDSGNPVKIGLKAANAFPTAEANADRVNAIGDLFGRQMTTHIDPAQQVWKSYNDTSSRSAGSAQVVWDPTGGKRIAVTSFVVSAYGTTAGRIFLFFAADADLTYTAGTDQPLLVASYAPSTTSKPGTVWTSGQTPIFCLTADHRIHYQNDAAISVDIVIYGYEW